jgi:hypothetical protein
LAHFHGRQGPELLLAEVSQHVHVKLHASARLRAAQGRGCAGPRGGDRPGSRGSVETRAASLWASCVDLVTGRALPPQHMPVCRSRAAAASLLSGCRLGQVPCTALDRHAPQQHGRQERLANLTAPSLEGGGSVQGAAPQWCLRSEVGALQPPGRPHRAMVATGKKQQPEGCNEKQETVRRTRTRT